MDNYHRSLFPKFRFLPGKLIGRFYDENGNPTEYNREFEKRISLAEKEKQLHNADKEMFPPCNVEWTADKGSRVWCTKKRYCFIYLPVNFYWSMLVNF